MSDDDQTTTQAKYILGPCAEPLGYGHQCGVLGYMVDVPIRGKQVLCPAHRQGWGRTLVPVPAE